MQGLIVVVVIAAVLLLVALVIKVASNPGGSIDRRVGEERAPRQREKVENS
ncbi:hypothetical protein [Nocardia mangyaensis]|uniref:hypothetical protein n=1 Tax=Nocardia mangyaensis TaxID=2213200 RepID=UPI002674BBE0|nr:hypothetical protein [Nocardia mangyaensis]MDO3648612.1 hypothetical protein [Nocardia mangyaensis]